MIRLRLGDIFKSNYSRFALARLFGFSEDTGFNLEGMTANTDGSTTNTTQNRIITEIQTLRNRMLGNDYHQGDKASLQQAGNEGYQRYGDTPTSALGAVAQRAPTGRRGRGNANTPDRLRNNATLQVDIKRQDTENHYIVGVVGPSLEQQGEWRVPVTSLRPDETFISQQAYRNAMRETTDSTDTGGNADVRGQFTDPSNNPVFKAFESTTGTGLAGFIKSIAFDFNDASWVTDQYNSRAPMMIGVNLEFAPIHDLHPGIDHNGFNTAPIYNVGANMASFGYDKQNEYDRKKLAFDAARKPLGRIAVPNS